jgi:hypothetical protein
MKLTFDQALVLSRLRESKIWLGCTEIGRAIGGLTCTGRQRESSWSSPILKSLVKIGLAERSQKPFGKYRAK